jgi:hypothetical protein
VANYAELQTNIADYFSRSDLTSIIQRAIKRAIKHYEREFFYFNEADLSFATVSGTQAYTLSATDGYSAINQVMVNYNNDHYEAERINLEVFENLNQSNSNGAPSVYAEKLGILYFYPVPNQTMTVSVNYVAKIATLSASGDENVFTLNAEDLIESRAAWWVATKKTKNRDDMARFKSDELEALKQLRKETDRKVSSGKITPSKF